MLEIDANFFIARHLLGLAYEQKGMFDEAISELEKASHLSGACGPPQAALAHTYAAWGRKTEARRVLNELLRLDHKAPYEIATIYLGLGCKQQALAWFQKSPKEKVGWLLRVDPRLDSLRSDSSFQKLLYYS